MTLTKHDYGRYDSNIHGLRLICICCGFRYLNYSGPASVLPSCPSCGAILEVQEDEVS